ncbi:type IV pilus assembly protein FimV [Thermomonas paludicola]|uniref:type IV pilus assembly protein FimV n=1 Tax=Thermomonas paludicola TaxID=2884874 RepID=UPI0021154A25|nr:FimV/HubP family polar landmark protein [Thermomonas paludicola]
MIRTLRTAVVAALLLAAGNAWALGLGQIEVKSRRNQPLLAEIPIVSTTPGELAELKARLASPDTFRRVGLSPPSGIAADLQFSLGKDAKGRPVIRVTTLKPVDQAVLNFLIEVDWGQGRLVREYSALVDVPNEVNSPLLPAIQAPQAPAPNLIRRAEPAPAVAPVQAPPAAVEAAAAPIAAQPVLATPAAEAPAAGTEIRPFPMQQPAAPPSPAPVVAPVPAAAADTARQYGPVKRGETLSAITGKLGLGKAFSLDQSMLALLRANPDAFLGDDVNQLRRGAVLRVPERDQIAQIDADEAAQVVRQQMQQWRQARRAVSQPAAMPAASAQQAATKPAGAAQTPAAPQRPAARKPVPEAPAATAAQANATAAAKPVRREDARLQIVPPSAPGKAAGTKSGTSAGGEGSMLQQQLRQRDEDIATKSAEIGELKARVAALEKLKEDQQQLISMKDSELAAAQQRLAEANKAAAQGKAPQAAAATKPSTPAAQAPADAPTQHGAMPYVWGGAGFAALALLAWVLARRNRQAPPPRRRVFDSEALAASMVSAGRPEEAQVLDSDMADAPAVETQDAGAANTVTTVIDLASVPPAPPRMDAPAWHSGWVKTEPASSEPAPSAVQDTVTPPAEASNKAQEAPAPAPAPVVTAANLSEPPAQASAEQRFKLVRAFLDMGDDYSAQQLLLELLDDPDEKVGDEAARMLSKLAG